MFNMDTYPAGACKKCVHAVEIGHRRFYDSLQPNFSCHSFHRKCFDERDLRFLTGKVSEVSVYESLCHGTASKAYENHQNVAMMKRKYKRYHQTDMVRHYFY